MLKSVASQLISATCEQLTLEGISDELPIMVYEVKNFSSDWISRKEIIFSLCALSPESWLNLQEGDHNEAGNGTDHDPDKEMLVTDHLL